MQRPQSFPKPILIGGFNEITNNTDQSGGNMIDKENILLENR